MRLSSPKKPPKSQGRVGHPSLGDTVLRSIRLPGELDDAVAAYAARKGIDRSAAIRELVEAGLKRTRR